MLAEARAQKLHSRTFAQCVDAYLDQHSSTWRNDKHRRQWRSTLNIAVDAFGDLDVRVVDTAMIVGLLTPIWAATPETGSRLRGRVEKVRIGPARSDCATARTRRGGRATFNTSSRRGPRASITRHIRGRC